MTQDRFRIIWADRDTNQAGWGLGEFPRAVAESSARSENSACQNIVHIAIDSDWFDRYIGIHLEDESIPEGERMQRAEDAARKAVLEFRPKFQKPNPNESMAQINASPDALPDTLISKPSSNDLSEGAVNRFFKVMESLSECSFDENS